MADAMAIDDRKLKVFISYSSKDEDFAQELLAGLQLVGFEPYLDKHDIAAGDGRQHVVPHFPLFCGVSHLGLFTEYVDCSESE